MNDIKAGVPSWMLEEKETEIQRDRDGFLTRSILKLTGLLSRVREESSVYAPGPSAQCKLIYTFLLILLAALSHNMMFTYCLLAGLLARIAFLKGKQVTRIVKSAAGAMVISMIILLPAIFFGSPRAMITVSLKVFLSVGLVMLMATTTPWNKVTSALKSFHVPAVIIFTFDITLKYIVILGDICLNALQAVKLRSVGKNRDKEKAFAGVLGMAFLKSRQMTDEMFDAMTCRGYDGEFENYDRYRFTGREFIGIGIVAAAGVLFAYFEFFV